MVKFMLFIILIEAGSINIPNIPHLEEWLWERFFT